MKKYRFLIFNILKKKKLCKFSIKMFIIMIIGYICILGLNSGIHNKYDDVKSKYIIDSYTTVSSQKKYVEIINDIKKTGVVKQYYPLLYYKSNIYDLIYIDNNIVNIKLGDYINNKNEIIVSSSTNLHIGDIVNLSVNSSIYKLLVVGIYDDTNYNISIKNKIQNPIICSYDLLYSLVDLNSVNEVIVQIDDYDNVESFFDKLHNYGSYDSIVNDENSNILNRYRNFSNAINNLSKVVILFIIMFVAIINFVIINDNKTDIAILKSFGYSNIKIMLLMLFNSLLLLSMSMISGIIITLILSLLFSDLILIKMEVIRKCLFHFSVINIVVLTIFFYFIKRINIIKLIKN